MCCLLSSVYLLSVDNEDDEYKCKFSHQAEDIYGCTQLQFIGLLSFTRSLSCPFLAHIQQRNRKSVRCVRKQVNTREVNSKRNVGRREKRMYSRHTDLPVAYARCRCTLLLSECTTNDRIVNEARNFFSVVTQHTAATAQEQTKNRNEKTRVSSRLSTFNHLIHSRSCSLADRLRIARSSRTVYTQKF